MIEIRAPLMASIEITTACNLRCAYCYAAEDVRKPCFMDGPTAIDLLSTLHRDFQVLALSISGGEPFLHPDMTEILHECVVVRGIPITVLTNATLLTRERVRSALAPILRAVDSGLEIQVSLDSPWPEVNDRVREHGVRVMEGIENLLDAGARVHLATVLTRTNIDTADDLIARYHPRIKKFHVMKLVVPRGAPQSLRDLQCSEAELDGFWRRITDAKARLPDLSVDVPAKHRTEVMPRSSIQACGCLAGVTRIEIDPQLNVFPCAIARDLHIGNLRTTSFHDIWRGERAERLRCVPGPLCGVSPDELGWAAASH